MIETLTKNINGSSYSVTQLTARRALRLQAKLIKLLGPSVSLFVSSYESEASEVFPKAINLLASQIDENEFENLVMDIIQGVRKDGVELTPSIIDLEFAGKINSLCKVLGYVLEVNFGDFLEPEGIIGQLLKKNPQT